MADGKGIWRNGLWHDLPDITVTVKRVAMSCVSCWGSVGRLGGRNALPPVGPV